MGSVPSYLPRLQAQWQSQLAALRLANRDAAVEIDAIQEMIDKNPALESSLQSQLDQAKLVQLQAAQKYNSFLESGSELIRVAHRMQKRD